MRSINTEGFMRKGIRALAFVSILAVSAGCASANTVWTLVGATFSDGAMATGWFSVDVTNTILTAYDVTLSGTGYSVAYPTDVFVSGSATDQSCIPCDYVQFYDSATGNRLTLNFSSPLTSLGGTIPLTIGDPADYYYPESRGFVTGGSVVGTPDEATPEPGTVSLMGAALAGIGLLWRKRAARA